MIGTKSMIERIAFRIFVQTGRAHAIGSAEDSWDYSKGSIVRRECEDIAMAVLKEMREPTIFAMNEGGKLVAEGPLQAEQVWQAMIDAELIAPTTPSP